MKRTTAIFLALITIACSTPREPGTTVPAVGEQAPGIELPLTGGGTWSLDAAVAQGPVAVIFYRGTF